MTDNTSEPLNSKNKINTLAPFYRRLRLARIAFAALSLALTAFLFVDVSGRAAQFWGWMAKIQFIPAVLALNFIALAAILLLTLLLGRVYCSVICPLGIYQDAVSRLSRRLKGPKGRLPFQHQPPWTKLKWAIFLAFSLLFCLGFASLAAFIEPYTAFGRMTAHLLGPIWTLASNALASLAASLDSYALGPTELAFKGLGALLSSLAVFFAVSAFAAFKGRLWCNAVCPVGTFLGLLSRFALFRPRFDNSKCVQCSLCEKSCRAQCIDVKAGRIDASRCVDCLDCAALCPRGAITFAPLRKASPPVDFISDSKTTDQKDNTKSDAASVPINSPEKQAPEDAARRAFLAAVGTAAGALALKKLENTAEAKESDGGLAPLLPRQAPQREVPLVPPGALSLANVQQHCTGCQLCIQKCPNNVLRPSSDLKRWMQPEMAFEHGRCRPECTACSSVCPTGAIRPIKIGQKSSIQIGHAVWNRELCLPAVQGISCGNCARHCPVGAIFMAPMDENDPKSPKVPFIDEARCIGCGACENLCPVRPVSAIVVQGHEAHREV